jgi:simple sugar transport system ATP-binding protein
MNPILKVRNIRKSFGPFEVLRAVDFEIIPGEVLALVGDSGAGKATLIIYISRVYRAVSDEIDLDGERMELVSPREALGRGIETICQDSV